MEKYQEIAWDCLTKQEQDSLFLNISQGISARKVSEMMEIPFYKYLELKARSEKLFKLFSDYFEIYPDLIRPHAPISNRFRDYLYGCILKRLSRDDAAIYTGDSTWLVAPVSNDRITRGIENLRASDNKWDKDLYALIIEFDRWNSFRILPRMLQAPSAYKRRLSKKHKVYINYLHRVPDFKIRAMVDMYWRNGKPENRYFVAFISSIFSDGYSVVPIMKNKKVVDDITKNKIYIFEKKEDASIFGVLVSRYSISTTDKGAAQFYWREYREVIQKAINYKYINNMDFTVNSLDFAFKLKRKSHSEIIKMAKKKKENSRL